MGEPLTEPVEVRYFEVLCEYFCQKCSTKYYSVRKKVEKQEQIKCPDCNNILSSLLSSPDFILNEIKTVGQLADKNTREMGHYEREDKQRKLIEDHLNSKKKAGIDIDSYNSRKREIEKLRKINNMTEQQKKDYILTGKND